MTAWPAFRALLAFSAWALYAAGHAAVAGPTNVAFSVLSLQACRLLMDSGGGLGGVSPSARGGAGLEMMREGARGGARALGEE